MKLVTADQMRALEQRADASGNPYAMMMERAGKAVADAVIARYGARAQRVLVLVGPGNNGGDGLVCARYLHDAGARVALYVWKRAERADDENFKLCRERNIPVTRAEDDTNFFALKDFLADADILVDALLGTGVARPIDGLLKDLLNVIARETGRQGDREAGRQGDRETGRPGDKEHLVSLSPCFPLSRSPKIVAVDLPSGLNPDTGALDPATLAADLTVTFAFPKIGQLRFPGANAVGELVVADIGIPAEWADADALDVATARDIAALVPPRPRDAHKGTFGKAMICAGSLNYVGAAFLAGAAATRAGAGLVTLALARTIYPMLASALHETTFVVLPDENGALVPAAAPVLLDHLSGYDALLLGCGFGRHPHTITFVQSLISNLQPPLSLVLDADALFALAHLAPNRAILTPHPGEMATLTGVSRDAVQADRVTIAKKFAAQWQQVVVLKGAFTVIAAPDGRATLLPFATPALATAGTGDVLAGTIVAMIAQGLNAYDAAIAGAYLHGLAGTLAEKDLGRAGVVAGDLLARLPLAIAQVKRET